MKPNLTHAALADMIIQDVLAEMPAPASDVLRGIAEQMAAPDAELKAAKLMIAYKTDQRVVDAGITSFESVKLLKAIKRVTAMRLRTELVDSTPDNSPEDIAPHNAS